MTRAILRWVDKNMDEAMSDDDIGLLQAGTKGFMLGAVEGLVDSCLVIGSITLYGFLSTVVTLNKR